jgi:hypothetical protein
MKLTGKSNFIPSKRTTQLRITLSKVRKQVRVYRAAKSAGTLRAVNGADRSGLFNV